jgi:dihydrodipicolinate synthase/N-acetylneuraminate lyase
MTIRTSLGAQRYNNRMHKIFEDAKKLQKAAAYEAAMQAVKRCASGELERPLTERSTWPDALQKLEAAIKHAS